jgi:hypothetical protein
VDLLTTLSLDPRNDLAAIVAAAVATAGGPGYLVQPHHFDRAHADQGINAIKPAPTEPMPIRASQTYL